MSTAIAVVLFVIALIVDFLLSSVLTDQYGFFVGAIVFVVIFLIAALALGKFASRQLIVTYEDQQREEKRKK